MRNIDQLQIHISIHALLTESDGVGVGNSNIRIISIHALLAESDLQAVAERDQVAISIHALLTESDTIFAVRPYDAPIFLSTLSLRRAT